MEKMKHLKFTRENLFNSETLQQYDEEGQKIFLSYMFLAPPYIQFLICSINNSIQLFFHLPFIFLILITISTYKIQLLKKTDALIFNFLKKYINETKHILVMSHYLFFILLFLEFYHLSLN